MAEESKTLVPIEQKDVEFYGDELPVLRVDTEGEPIIYAPIRPICDYLGINWSAQYRYINRNPVLSAKPVPCVVVTTTQGQLDQQREMLCLSLNVVNRFLFGINISQVREELRERIIQ